MIIIYQILIYHITSNLQLLFENMITIDHVESGIQNLPQDLRDRALQYIEELNNEYQQSEKKLSFDWVGELEDEEPSLTTVEIQHKIHTLEV